MKLFRLICLGVWCSLVAQGAQAGCDRRAVAKDAEDLYDTAKDMGDEVWRYDDSSMDDLLRRIRGLMDSADFLISRADRNARCSELRAIYDDVVRDFRYVYREVVESIQDSHDGYGPAVIVGGYREVTIGDGRTRLTGPSSSYGPGRHDPIHANFELAAYAFDLDEIVGRLGCDLD